MYIYIYIYIYILCQYIYSVIPRHIFLSFLSYQYGHPNIEPKYS